MPPRCHLARALLAISLVVSPDTPATASPAPAAPRLTDWMGDLMPLIGNLTLAELSLVETHNSASHNLTGTFSDNCKGFSAQQSALLHDLELLRGNPAGTIAERWSRVQSLPMIEQLDAGVRALDFRMIWTAPWNALSSAKHDWYVNHRVQSREPAAERLAALRTWMDAHPNEVVLLRVSRHGESTFPHTPDAALQTWFAAFCRLMDGLLVDWRRAPAGSTPLRELVARGRRLHVQVSDFSRMTRGGSFLVNEPVSTRQCARFPERFTSLASDLDAAAAACFKAPHLGPGLAELSLAPDPPTSVYVAAAALELDSARLGRAALTARCARAVWPGDALPGTWCPGSILEYERLQNYYAQWLLEAWLAAGPAPSRPNILFVNALGEEGTLRVDAPTDAEPKRYALVDATLLLNVRAGCAAAANDACAATEAALRARMALRPRQTWSDPAHGRFARLPS
jgi:hypothetical protein